MTAALDTDVLIETPEHIEFHYRIAGPARRAAAYLLDLLICYGVLAIVTVVIFAGLGMSLGESGVQAGGGLFLVLLFAAQWLYFLVWEGKTGRSPGKRAFGLRVLTTTGRPIGFGAAALRNLLRAADALPIANLVGVLSMALSSKFQRIGDLVAGTMVVVPETAYAAEALELRPAAAPKELRDLPEDVVLDADERAAIELF
ncbi:MAG TPA: RDD family protein, partial [Labilithrix sp.]